MVSESVQNDCMKSLWYWYCVGTVSHVQEYTDNNVEPLCGCCWHFLVSMLLVETSQSVRSIQSWRCLVVDQSAVTDQMGGSSDVTIAADQGGSIVYDFGVMGKPIALRASSKGFLTCIILVFERTLISSCMHRYLK